MYVVYDRTMGTRLPPWFSGDYLINDGPPLQYDCYWLVPNPPGDWEC